MRWKLSAGVLVALALLIPAAPALAETGPTGLNAACQTVERTVYKDFRELVTIDVDTATEVQVRMQADRILAEANAESLLAVPRALQEKLDGTPDDLRAFLKSGLQGAWTTDLRVAAVRTLSDAGPHVRAAAQKVLDDGAVDDYLAFLNDGLYAARALDCASHPTPTPHTPTPSVKPSATTSGAAIPPASAGPAASGGNGGGLPVTGAATGVVAAAGGALLLMGGAGYLIGRRRRSRFVA